MLSAETIKEDDARQNAGAQRLLKAHMGKKKNKTKGIFVKIRVEVKVDVELTKSSWWFQIFRIFTPKIGEDFQFDFRIFFRWVEATTQNKFVRKRIMI